jgi:hypothetical protein
MAVNNKTRFSNIITTIAIAVFLVFWTLIDRRLSNLESRMRSLELQVTAISVQLGIDTGKQYSSDTVKPLHNQPPDRGQLH